MESSFFKLSSGADVLNSLQELQINTNSTSFLLSAVGDLSKVSFRCPINEKPINLDKKLEIITLTGYLTSKSSHLHISVSDENCNVFGGHLLFGTTVLKSLDILLGVIPNIKQQTIPNINNCFAIVDIYVLPDCPWSKRALKLLNSYHVKYNYHLISSDNDFEKISNRTSFNTFPQIFIKNEFIGGYSELAELHNNGTLRKLIS